MSITKHQAEGIKSVLRAFLASPVMPLAKASEFGDDDSFMEKGILDSTGVLELVGFIEQQFSIRVESDELVPDNLDSLSKVVSFIQSKGDSKQA
jgi:acyl carrier protein